MASGSLSTVSRTRPQAHSAARVIAQRFAPTWADDNQDSESPARQWMCQEKPAGKTVPQLPEQWQGELEWLLGTRKSVSSWRKRTRQRSTGTSRTVSAIGSPSCSSWWTGVGRDALPEPRRETTPGRGRTHLPEREAAPGDGKRTRGPSPRLAPLPRQIRAGAVLIRRGPYTPTNTKASGPACLQSQP